MNTSTLRFNNASACFAASMTRVADILRHTVDESGAASLALSGGKTPESYLPLLARKVLDWSRVTITLTDERCVPHGHPASNFGLVLRHLGDLGVRHLLPLVNADGVPNSDATGENLQQHKMLPLDMAVLGMGTDGHTASIFPGQNDVESLGNFQYVHRVSGIDRVTFSFEVLAQTRWLILVLVGDAKSKLWSERCDERGLPIDLLVRRCSCLEVFIA